MFRTIGKQKEKQKSMLEIMQNGSRVVAVGEISSGQSLVIF